MGTTTFTGTRLGYNLYLDGGFKVYSFNNILAGRTRPGHASSHGHCGYFMVFGFLDHLFNNTIHGFEYGLNGSSGNRSCILGNVMAVSFGEKITTSMTGITVSFTADIPPVTGSGDFPSVVRDGGLPPIPSVSAMVCRSPYFFGTSKSITVHGR